MGIKTFETREALKNKLHNRKLIFSENELDEVLISHNYFNLFIRFILIIDEYVTPHMIEFPDLFQIC